MDVLQIKTLIDAMAASDLAGMELSRDGWTLRLSRDPVASPPKPSAASPAPARSAPVPAVSVAPVKPAAAAVPQVVAPLAGVVYLTPNADADPFAPVGHVVKAGDTVCVVEAMKVFVEVKAERAGTVEAVLVATGDEVDAGQPLFKIA